VTAPLATGASLPLVRGTLTSRAAAGIPQASAADLTTGNTSLEGPGEFAGHPGVANAGAGDAQGAPHSAFTPGSNGAPGAAGLRVSGGVSIGSGAVIDKAAIAGDTAPTRNNHVDGTFSL
jgi:hypothetical protein